MTTTTMTLQIENKPGQLASVTRCLADNGVNITAFTADGGRVCLNTTDNDKAATCLQNEGFDVNKNTTFAVDLPNEPGRLADLTEKLGGAGVNITTTFGVVNGDTGTVFTIVDNPEAAEPVFRKFGTATIRT